MRKPPPATALEINAGPPALPSESPAEVLRRVRMFFRPHSGQVYSLVKTTSAEWMDDKAPRLSASLAFYTALSLAPLMVVVLAIAALAFGRAAAEGQLVAEIQTLAGSEGARAIRVLLERAHRPATGLFATALGLVTLFFGATSAIVDLRDALNTIWHVPTDESARGFRNVLVFFKERFQSFALVLGAGFLLLVSLVINATLSALGSNFAAWLPTPEPVLQAFDFVVSFLVIAFIFGFIFRFLPDVVLKASDVAVGAGVTSLLFSIGKLLIGMYLGRGAVGSAYGAAGSFVVLLVWLYYSSLVFFWGAEFTKVYTRTIGSAFTGRLLTDSRTTASPAPPLSGGSESAASPEQALVR